MIAPYDPDVHHVGLGADPDSVKGLITVGPHSKQLASPVFEKPSNFGVDGDLIGSRNYSIWTQNDYTGGEFQDDVIDPAMFAESVMMLSDPLGKSLRTCRPMRSQALGIGVPNTVPVSMEVVDSGLFIVYNNEVPRCRVLRYDTATGFADAETVDNAYLPTGKIVTAAAWNQSSEQLWLGSNKPRIHSYHWDNALGTKLVHNQDYGTPVLDGDPITRISGIHIFGKLRMCTTRHGNGDYDDNRMWIYVNKFADNANWTQIGILPGDYVDSATFNSAVYVLTRSGDSRTQLSYTDGTDIFPVLEFPYAFRGYQLCEYAGRLFIAGLGYALDGTPDYGELYEVSGTSLRLVRTWVSNVQQPDPAFKDNEFDSWPPYDGVGWPGEYTYPNGPVLYHPAEARGVRPPNSQPPHGGDPPTGVHPVPVHRKVTMDALRSLVVNEGLLWMPDGSWTGLEAYDATTDGFFGGPRYRAGHDSTTVFTHMVSVGGNIVAWGSNADITKQGLYRVEHREASTPYYPYVTTSDFSPEPGRLKTWGKFAVLCRGDGAPYLDYSVDSGKYWFRLDAESAINVGYRNEVIWDLNVVPPSRSIRFRITFAQPGTVTEIPSELISHSLGFIIRGDDKKRWQFTVNAAEGLGDIADNLEMQTPGDVIAHVWAMKDAIFPVTYRDVDGQDYQVVITDISENHPAILESGEAYLPVTLVEV